MRDGVTLYADIYRPDGPGAYPALLVRTPYDKEAESTPFMLAAVRRGYVVVIQDVRGQFKSGGSFLPYLQEINDGYDTIEWVASLPFVNGKVGTFGLSYPGAVQWMTAPTRPPHLVAMAPAMTFANARHFVYDGGVFVSPILNWLLGRQVRERRERGLPLATAEEVRDAWTQQAGRWLTFLPLRDLPIMRPFGYWAEWLDHPDDDPYWAPFDIEAQHNRVEVPALNLTSWNDDSYGQPGAIRNYLGMVKNGATERARRGQRLVIGPWTHGVPMMGQTKFNGIDYGPSAALDYNDLLLQFFDYWLRGIDDNYSTQPPIRIFVMGDNEWRAENEWPPARTRYQDLFLRKDGVLDRQGPAAGEAPDRLSYDPRNPVRLASAVRYEIEPGSWRMITSRRDVLSYTTAPLERDIEITGLILGELWVSSTAPDTDFTMRVLDLSPDGSPTDFVAAFGRLRARYRSTEKEAPPQPLPPEKATLLTIGMGYTSNVIKAGHRLQVLVTGSVFPYVHLNVWEPFVSMSQAVVATDTIYHDADHPSRIILPLIPREATRPGSSAETHR
jgi:putative CocE/NonD family hydrolase